MNGYEQDYAGPSAWLYKVGDWIFTIFIDCLIIFTFIQLNVIKIKISETHFKGVGLLSSGWFLTSTS